MNLIEGFKKMGSNSKEEAEKRKAVSRTAGGTAQLIESTDTENNNLAPRTPFAQLNWAEQGDWWFSIGERCLSDKQTLYLWRGYFYKVDTHSDIKSIVSKAHRCGVSGTKCRFLYPEYYKHAVKVPRYMQDQRPDMNWCWYDYAVWLPFDSEFKLAPWMEKIFDKYEYVNGHPMWMTEKIKRLNKIENLRKVVGFVPNTRFNWLGMGYILVDETQWGYVGTRNVYKVLQYSNGNDFIFNEDIVALNQNSSLAGLDKESIKSILLRNIKLENIDRRTPIMRYVYPNSLYAKEEKSDVYTVKLDEKVRKYRWSDDYIPQQEPGDPNEYTLYEHPILYSPFGHNISIFNHITKEMILPPLLCGYIKIDEDKYVPVGTDISLDYRNKIGQTDNFMEAYREFLEEKGIEEIYPYCKVLRVDDPIEKDENPSETQLKNPAPKKKRMMDIEIPAGYAFDDEGNITRKPTIRSVPVPDTTESIEHRISRDSYRLVCSDIAQRGVYYGLYGEDMLNEV